MREQEERKMYWQGERSFGCPLHWAKLTRVQKYLRLERVQKMRQLLNITPGAPPGVRSINDPFFEQGIDVSQLGAAQYRGRQIGNLPHPRRIGNLPHGPSGEAQEGQGVALDQALDGFPVETRQGGAFEHA